MLVAGGPIVFLLLVMSVGSLALIAVKVAHLRGVTAGESRRHAAIEAFATGDHHAAQRALEGATAPADRMTLTAMKGLAANRPRAVLVAELEWRGNAEMAVMQRHIRLLELIAMVSPLLGLLGTVLGMISAFQQLALAQGAANASLLAGGIWTALLTTAAGLLVAIPAAVGATLLSEWVERAGTRIETDVGQLLTRYDAGV
ncbi:MotA/TolQ/ExbB proton channel family protein [Loktanella sp. M215]|nr:MotA/TolQ/ExbB proton channel family protein [Loktanella sp. M215]MCF7699887.1 MotA/TolQ/ExbB proton channel family protein [Loktanella sp. M215]